MEEIGGKGVDVDRMMEDFGKVRKKRGGIERSN